jgi:hypothetical protein
MITLTVTGPYTAKDQVKANPANKFIGRGSSRSSTNSYAQDFGQYANCGSYSNADSVFVSAEGNRRGRLTPNLNEINLAIKAGAMFITDVPFHRNREYNVGEREVASHLAAKGYKETPLREYSLWHPA